MSLVVSIAILVVIFAGYYLRVLSGKDNGAFYAKGVRRPKELVKYIDNLHFIETPFWWVLFGMIAVVVFALLFEGGEPWYMAILESFLITRGSSAMANYQYQKYINIGSGLPAVDPNENPRSEFAWGPISFWWPRFGYGPRRKFIPYLGALIALIGMGLTLL